MVWFVIWIVLMMFWLFGGGGYYGYTKNYPSLVGVIIPWLCVLILGLMYFGALPMGSPAR